MLVNTPRWLLWQFINNINEQYSNSDYNEVEIEMGKKSKKAIELKPYAIPKTLLLLLAAN